ncbi:MAG: SusD/RagB family nutrient-binding outer membrane lipoprotein [Bacteroidales bacterium]|nr:SusD/RagB family nutrient-binding outer membrane lipoprotein [Bacteroidales bacterium]
MKKILYILSAVTVLSLASCKDYLDINHSPNNPDESQATADMTFPAAEMALSARYGDVLRIIGGYLAEHYVQYFGTSNYLTYSQFKVAANSTNGAYVDINRGAIANATIVRDKGAEEGKWGTYLAATVIRVFAFQVLVDAYGDAAYSEFGLGLENLNPKYDQGADVYAGLVAELDDALSKVNQNPSVATNLLYPGEDATNWVKFANALKLKLLMRERAVVNVDSQLQALVNEGNFPDKDVAWTCFTENASGKANPFYQEEFASYFGSTQTNVALNVALFRAMSGDGRLDKFFSKPSSGYWGSISGYNMSVSDNFKAAKFSRPAMTYDSPVYLITLSEIDFFLSEYYRKVAKDNAKAKDYYEAAIKASFASAGASGAGNVIENWPYDGTDKSLGIQKWVALSGTNNFEAWCEMRRLGYPTFGGLKAEEIYSFSNDSMNASVLTPGDLYTPYQVDSQIGDNALVQRFPYAQSSQLYNKNCPAVVPNSTKVFWAK